MKWDKSLGDVMNTRAENMILVLWTVLVLCNAKDNKYGPECEYGGDMCDATFINCIKKMEDNGDIYSCRMNSVYYGSGNLFESREDTKFWINLYHPSRYRFDARYTILSMANGTAYESLSSITGCCSMNSSNHNDTCTLPKKKPLEEQVIYLPLPKNSERSYCRFKIKEQAGRLEYCVAKQNKPCLEFIDGVLRVKNAFGALSTQHIPRAEHCTFPTPSEFVTTNRNDSKSLILYPQSNMNFLKSGDNLFAKFGEKEVKCNVMKSDEFQKLVQRSDQHRSSETSDYICFFTRAPPISTDWSSTARCMKLQIEETSSSSAKNIIVPETNIIVVVVVIAGSLISVFATVIIVIWRCKKHRDNLYKRNIAELRNAQEKTHVDLVNGVHFSLSGALKEIPEEIKISNEHEERYVEREDQNLLDKKQQPKSEDRSFMSDEENVISERMECRDSGCGSGGEGPENEESQGGSDEGVTETGLSKNDFSVDNTYEGKSAHFENLSYVRVKYKDNTETASNGVSPSHMRRSFTLTSSNHNMLPDEPVKNEYFQK